MRNPPIPGRLPAYAQGDKKPLAAWYADAIVRREFRFNTHDLEEMDHEQYIFLIGIVEAESRERERQAEAARKEAEAAARNAKRKR